MGSRDALRLEKGKHFSKPQDKSSTEVDSRRKLQVYRILQGEDSVFSGRAAEKEHDVE